MQACCVLEAIALTAAQSGGTPGSPGPLDRLSSVLLQTTPTSEGEAGRGLLAAVAQHLDDSSDAVLSSALSCLQALAQHCLLPAASHGDPRAVLAVEGLRSRLGVAPDLLLPGSPGYQQWVHVQQWFRTHGQ